MEKKIGKGKIAVIASYVILIACIIGLGLNSLNLQKVNTALKNKKDCTIHIQTIKDLQAELDALKKATGDSVTFTNSEAEQIVLDSAYETFKTFKDIPQDESYGYIDRFAKMKTEMTRECFIKQLPSTLTVLWFEDDSYKDQLKEMNTPLYDKEIGYYNTSRVNESYVSISGDTAKVTMFIQQWAYYATGYSNADKPILFQVSLKYDEDTKKWLVSDITRSMYLDGESTQEYTED